MQLTEKEQRIYDRLRDVEPVKHGYGWRWRFKGSLEPVTKEIRSMTSKGLLEECSTGFGRELRINSEHPCYE